MSEQGEDYARKMTERLLAHRESERQAMIERAETGYELRPLKVWTSTRRRTVETAMYFHDEGYTVRQRSQMSQLNPGVCEKMSEKRIRMEFPDEVAKHELDPYHHRYPRAEVSARVPTGTNPRLIICPPSHTTTLPSAWSRSFWNWKGNRTICSSSLTKASCESCMATSWPAMPRTFPF